MEEVGTMRNSIPLIVMEICPHVENRTFRTKPLTTEPGETIGHLKKLSAESFGRLSSEIHLIYFGKVLEDALTCEAAGIRAGSTVLVYSKTTDSNAKPAENKHKVKQKIICGIQRLYEMKYLYILAKSEFLERLYFDMPELDTSTFALLQTSRLLVKWMLPKYSDELDTIAENYPLLGEVLWKAIEWAPSLLRVIPPENPNVFSLDTGSDDSENESMEEATSTSNLLNRLSNRRSSAPIENVQRALRSNEDGHVQSGDVQYQPQPGPSREPQPGPSQTGQSRPVTGPMLQAALQAVFSNQAGVAEVTFAWQLKTMRDMGFTDEKACIEALVKHGGDVDSAVHELLQD